MAENINSEIIRLSKLSETKRMSGQDFRERIELDYNWGKMPAKNIDIYWNIQPCRDDEDEDACKPEYFGIYDLSIIQWSDNFLDEFELQSTLKKWSDAFLCNALGRQDRQFNENQLLQMFGKILSGYSFRNNQEYFRMLIESGSLKEAGFARKILQGCVHIILNLYESGELYDPVVLRWLISDKKNKKRITYF
ncbi:MAG: hypothetical protein ACYCUW_01085 [bacterium]